MLAAASPLIAAAIRGGGTSAGLSLVALAQQMTPKYYTYCFHRPFAAG